MFYIFCWETCKRLIYYFNRDTDDDFLVHKIYVGFGSYWISLDRVEQSTINFLFNLILYLEYAPFITFTNVNERFRVTRLRENMSIYLFMEREARGRCV